MLTLKALLEEATEAIGRTDAHVIAAHVLGVNRAYLAAHPMRFITESEDARINLAVAQRALGQPVAYIVEKREFYGREFIVTPEVLIPRPETETLVEAVLERMPAEGSCLDLGTGSGAVAVTLACERPRARVTATDISADALAIARRNAAGHGAGARIDFRHGEWYAALDAGTFDVICANPPYVARDDPHLAQGDLRFEPRPALTDGSADGLDSIRAIVAGASERLGRGGWLLVEHGYDQAEAVHALLEATGFVAIVSIADLAGIARVAGGKIG
jgi:release factor glutamine methyltransferase